MSMIKEDYVSFETAKLLKKNGFAPKYEIGWFYNKHGVAHFISDQDDKYWGHWDGDIPCVTQALAMKWLREEHHLSIEISSCCNISNGEPIDIKWAARKVNLDMVAGSCYLIGRGDTYAEACDKAIQYCLNNLHINKD